MKKINYTPEQLAAVAKMLNTNTSTETRKPLGVKPTFATRFLSWTYEKADVLTEGVVNQAKIADADIAAVKITRKAERKANAQIITNYSQAQKDKALREAADILRAAGIELA